MKRPAAPTQNHLRKCSTTGEGFINIESVCCRIGCRALIILHICTTLHMYDTRYSHHMASSQVSVHQPFFLANRLFRWAKTLGTLNWTYSRSRSSWLSFCISRRSSSLRSNSRRPRLRPGEVVRSQSISTRGQIPDDHLPL